jgi:predicted RNase H-like HicB family nuclease
MSQMGPLPVNCAIEAASLEEAMQKFPEAIAEAIERMVEEAKEMQRQEASRIIVPGAAPGGGKIKLS